MDWGYISGYFDGEGTVTFSGSHPRYTKGLHWFNTHKESLEAMQAYMGSGRVSVRHHHSGFNGRKPAYMLSITSKTDMLHAIDGMLPHLIIKRARVEQLRDYLLTQVREHRVVNLGVLAALSDEELSRLYHDEQKTYADLAEMFGVSAPAVAHQFRRRGIKARTTGALLKGRPKSEATRARMKAVHQKLWQDPVYREQKLENLRKGPMGGNKRRPKT